MKLVSIKIYLKRCNGLFRPPALTAGICAMCRPRRRELRDIRSGHPSRRDLRLYRTSAACQGQAASRWLGFCSLKEMPAQVNLGISALWKPDGAVVAWHFIKGQETWSENICISSIQKENFPEWMYGAGRIGDKGSIQKEIFSVRM